MVAQNFDNFQNLNFSATIHNKLQALVYWY